MDEADMSLAEQFAGAISCAQFTDLNALAKKLWTAFAAGHLSDGEAQQLAEQIEAKRPQRLVTSPGNKPPAPKRQRSPDKIASIERRRRLAACWPVCPAHAAKFTTSELAALRVIADELKRYGSCAMFIDKVAAIAGTCRTVVKNALRKARAMRLLTVEERRRRGQRSLTNVIRFLCATWREWITRRKTGVIFQTTTDHSFRTEGKSDVVESFKQGVGGGAIARSVPSPQRTPGVAVYDPAPRGEEEPTNDS
jgi:hypothetical protein